MGSISWKGETLRSGSRLFIGGKEVELDSQVSASQLPGGNGTTPEDKEDEPVVIPEPTSTRGVAASSFYAAVKPKAKGPLYVCVSCTPHSK